jgi:methionyl aminopeptidase
MVRRKHRRPSTSPVRLAPEEVERMREVGRFASGLLDRVAEMIQPGLTTEEIDRFVDAETRARGAVSAPYRYPPGSAHPFPKHCCTSVNEVVCHGIPSPDQKLREGDIVNVDVTPRLHGWHGDTNRTFLVGRVQPEARRLVEVTWEATLRGIAAVRPGGFTGDIGHAIQTWVEAQGFSVVRKFAGHGIGRIFHGPPTIAHYGRPSTGWPLVPGMTFTIEPMVNAGDADCVVLPDHWTAVTVDRALSAQFEHTVTVTEEGVEVLTLSEGVRLELPG